MGSSRLFIIFALRITGFTAGGQVMLSEVPLDQTLLKLQSRIPISRATTTGLKNSTIQLERVG